MDDPSYRPGDWLIGRSTYFDAPASWKAKFAPHLFGDLHGNGCGSFTNKGPGLESNDNFTLPLDQAAAIADFDPRFYEGACGTCYEIGCITGPILDVATPENQTKLPLEAGGSTSGRSFYDVDQNAWSAMPGDAAAMQVGSGWFGWRIALSGDGRTAALSTKLQPSMVRVYRWDDVAGWQTLHSNLCTEVTGVCTSGEAYWLSLSHDGNTVAIGDFAADDPGKRP